jgi:hypothetical protein
VKADEVFDEMVAARPDPDAILFVGRTGEEYAWRECPPGEPMTSVTDGGFPDAWVFGSIAWPVDADVVTQRAFFDDLLAEMETMADGPDRCRWEFDDPYGHRH